MWMPAIATACVVTGTSDHFAELQLVPIMCSEGENVKVRLQTSPNARLNLGVLKELLWLAPPPGGLCKREQEENGGVCPSTPLIPFRIQGARTEYRLHKGKAERGLLEMAGKKTMGLMKQYCRNSGQALEEPLRCGHIAHCSLVSSHMSCLLPPSPAPPIRLRPELGNAHLPSYT